MSSLHTEFEKDITCAKSSVEFISSWDSILGIKEEDVIGIKGTITYALVTSLKDNYIAFRIDQNIIRGSIILYSVGRFEIYVRQLIEDICERYIVKAGSFEKLPKALRDNLIVYTGIVIQDPRKYGHADRGVEAFIKTLHENMQNITPCTKINTECITITDTNMRPEMLAQLFERIGAQKVIEKIGAQAAIMSFFETTQNDKAASEFKTKLNILMDLRNKIAHPAPSFTWPSKEEIVDYIEFLQITGKVLDDIANMYVAGLTI